MGKHLRMLALVLSPSLVLALAVAISEVSTIRHFTTASTLSAGSIMRIWGVQGGVVQAGVADNHSSQKNLPLLLSLRGGSRKNSISKRRAEHKSNLKQFHLHNDRALAKSRRKFERKAIEAAVGDLSLAIENLGETGKGKLVTAQQRAELYSRRKRDRRAARGRVSTRDKKEVRRRKKMVERFAAFGKGKKEVHSLLYAGRKPVGL